MFALCLLLFILSVLIFLLWSMMEVQGSQARAPVYVEFHMFSSTVQKSVSIKCAILNNI